MNFPSAESCRLPQVPRRPGWNLRPGPLRGPADLGASPGSQEQEQGAFGEPDALEPGGRGLSTRQAQEQPTNGLSGSDAQAEAGVEPGEVSSDQEPFELAAFGLEAIERTSLLSQERSARHDSPGSVRGCSADEQLRVDHEEAARHQEQGLGLRRAEAHGMRRRAQGRPG